MSFFFLLRRLLVIVCVPLLTACFDFSAHETEELDVRPNVAGVKIPVTLWQEIEKVYTQESAHESAVKAPTTDPLAAADAKQIPLRYTKFSISLQEAEKGVLGGKNLLLNFGQGGGVLDFADYVSTGRGGFRFAVKVDMLEEDVERFKVFLWPNGKRRKIKDTVYGGSCDKILDVTDYFRSRVLQSGIQVALTSEKYVALLAGTYVFVVKKNTTLFIAQLTVKDSRYPDLQCRA